MKGFRFSCLVILLAVCGSLMNSSLFAHHSIALEHDTTRILDVTGVIKETDWNNPHAFVRLDVNGKSWLVMMLSPNALKMRGVERSKLEVGKTFSAVGYPNRVLNEIYAQSITLDGKTTELFPR
jgi:hypothetical protein